MEGSHNSIECQIRVSPNQLGPYQGPLLDGAKGLKSHYLLYLGAKNENYKVIWYYFFCFN